MRSSQKNSIFRGLAVMAVAAPLLVGCNDSSPTEPRVLVATTPTPTPTPLPPGGSVAGTWTGTFSTDNIEFCFCSGIPAQATFEQDGSMVRGILNAPTAPCFALEGRAFTGTLHGNTMLGSVGSFGYVQGTLSGTTFEIGLGINPYGYASEGQLHLHR
jgi:hypothetical protein